MTTLTPDQSRALSDVFNHTKTFDDLWNQNISLAKRVVTEIQDVELKGTEWKDLPEDTKQYLIKALTELGRDPHAVLPGI